MDKKQAANSTYWWTGTDKEIISPPLDYSFMKADSFDDLSNKNLQTTRTGRTPKRTAENRYQTNSLWISHNSLTSTLNLTSFINQTLDNPRMLSWLDLSFNEILDIGEEFGEFSNLKILYLHGNKISNINNVLKLRKLTKLRTLTLHGNPIELLSNYRSYIVIILPKLMNLDFSPIITLERKKALPTGFFKTINTSD